MIKKLNYCFCIIIGLIVFIFTIAPIIQAQYWVPLPPYNTLWPLWSPALSPVDSSTGLPVPIINDISPSTVLPVQPGLTWDPTWDYPWLLYNTPTGLSYFDQIYGFNIWPPEYLLNAPIVLKGSLNKFPPTLIDWGQIYVPLANSIYTTLYDLDLAAFSLLLTPAAIWGL